MREQRSERCPDCHEQRDREWEVRDVDARAIVLGQWHTERRQGGTKRVARPTRWVSVCACDA